MSSLLELIRMTLMILMIIIRVVKCQIFHAVKILISAFIPIKKSHF